MINNFEDLEVWKECRNLRKQVSTVLKTFPSGEKYRMIDQLIRASRSLPLILLKDMDAFIIRKTFNFVVKPVVYFQKHWIILFVHSMKIISQRTNLLNSENSITYV